MRALLKRHIPTPLRNMVIAARRWLAAPPMDEVVLADYTFASENSAVPRLNLVIPNLSKATAFGGVMTGLDIFFCLAERLRANGAWDLRIILTEPGRDTDVAIAANVAARHGILPEAITIELLAPLVASLNMRHHDILIAYNWWCALNVRPLIEQQSGYFGQAPLPLLYLIQEYEPNFYPFSTAHMLAREAYDGEGRLWGVFNSSNLHQWFEHVGHRAERSFIFEPVINDALRPFLTQFDEHERVKRILVYGRPNITRNCFSAIVRGLNAWIALDPDHAAWEIVSAGTSHPPIRLSKGHVIRSLGKLSLDEYARLMLTSSVGISLMASPHPSYPPLEMAHFGLRTVTNGYFLKNLEDWHPNIISTDAISASHLGKAIEVACAMSREPASVAINAEFVRDEPYRFMTDLVVAVTSLVRA